MTRTVDAARGKWRGILMQLGVEDRYLLNKHGPCPMCGGRDRYRWDNKAGNGTFICSQCGAGDGLTLLMRLNNWTFRRAAQQVDQIVARVVTSPEQPEGGAADPSIRLNRLWQRSVAVTVGDRVHDYLQSRGLELPIATGVLRFCASCRNPDGSRHPAMLAMVTDPEGHPVTIHRTFLGPSGKADVAAPRALMPGQVPHGSAVRLAPFADRLGVAEGIETALAATAQFGIPTWSALNANLLKQWEPPSSVREVVIFGDADVSFTGQAAAYALANRLVNKLRVDVKIPSSLGCDWADVA